MRHPIAQTKNGVEVYIDLIRSKAASHVSKSPYLLGLISEALAQTDVTAKRPSLEFDMKREVGYDFTVSTKDNDTIVYARLLGEQTFSRLVKNSDPKPTTYLSIELARDDSGQYEVIDTWIGRINPPQPDGSNDTKDSINFWSRHALVLENRPIQLSSLTKTCPY